MKIAIIDKLGLCYDGTTVEKQGLGGSESAVIYISKELQKIGFDVTVFNNCIDATHSQPGTYDGVRYIDNTESKAHNEEYDAVIVSRSIIPFVNNEYPFLKTAKKRILWLHDTFIEGEQIMEELVLNGTIHHVFTLSDWHTSYILNSDHGNRRNYEVLKKCIFQTRNGAVQHIDEIDLSKKDKNHFVYNSSATKGMVPLIEDIWPEIKKRIPEAKLTIIGGYYRFREGAEPDAQENTVAQYASRQDLKDNGITFTGVISQKEIAEILSNSYMMLYPGLFPETFGISTLESLLYKTPLVTTRFGALEETAINEACYLIDYAIAPNGLFPNIQKKEQVKKFLDMFFFAYNNPYLHKQKQNYCEVIKDIAGWDTVALQWKQFLFKEANKFLPRDEYRKVKRINQKVSRVFGRTSSMPFQKEYSSSGLERRIVVVSPFWNASEYLEKHILSVAQQDYDNYIHLLIDDNSDDGSKEKIKEVLSTLPIDIGEKILYGSNETNIGCIKNQLEAIYEMVNSDDIVILLDGDDWLINNNTIFKYYNDLYEQGYEFTYGSMWSVVDNIPLIAQEYPLDVRLKKTYRDHMFNWKIPYTHLRTCLGKHFDGLNDEAFKVDGEWMKSGADNPLFYELIERVDADKIYCNREVVCNYNDASPYNDYKIKGKEQNRNADLSYVGKEDKVTKKILVAIPTNRYIEPETFKSIFDLDVPSGYELDFQYFYGYQIDQIRNLIAEWGKRYDYLLSVDSDIILPKDALVKMIQADKDIVSGLYIQRIPDTHTIEIYMVTPNGGVTNIPSDMLLQHEGLVEVAGCGFGCCLVKSNVLREMDYPHFKYKSALSHDDSVSEDVYFCVQAREKGFKVWADTTILCEHKGDTLYKVDKKSVQKKPVDDYVPASISTGQPMKASDLIKRKDKGVTVIPDQYKNVEVFQ